MNYKTKRILGDIVVGAILALVIALAAHGAEPSHKPANISPAQAIASWKALDDQCRGSQDLNPPECATRDRLTARMQAAGMLRTRFDVWVTRSQASAMATALVAATQRAADTGRPLAGEVALRQSLDDLRIPDDVVVGWWLAARGAVQQANPLAWAIMSDVVAAICVVHRGEQPYSMDY